MADGGKLIIRIDGDTKAFENSMDSVKSGISAANRAFLAVGAAGVAAFGMATKAGMDFEAQMSTVSAISGATAADMELLNSKAKQMGIDTAFSATEAGQAMEYMAMAGWKTEDMLNGIEGIMNLAAASGENLASVSDIVTDAMTAFGLSADQSGRFADVLAAASSNANTNVGLMGETFKYVAPVAGAMGFSIEDTAAAIGLMANAGIKGSQAGTALRSMLTRLSKPPKEAAEAIEALGLEVTNADGSFKDFRDIIGQLRNSFGKLTEKQKTTYAAMLGGQEAMSGLLAIVNAGEGDFLKLTGAIDNANGSAKEMADVKMDNLKGQITLLGSSFEGLGIAIYEKFGKALTDVVRSAIEKINNLTRALTNGDLDGWLTGIAATITGIGVALLSLNAAIFINDVIRAMKGLEASTNAVAAAQQFLNMVRSLDPIYLIITATIALTAAVWAGTSAYSYFIEQNSEIIQATQKIVEESEKAIETTNQLADSLNHLCDDAESRIADLEAEAYASKALADELFALSGQTDLTAEQKERMQYIVEQLNKSVDDLNLSLDTETGQLNMTRDAVDDVIDRKLELAKTNAMQELYTEQLKEQYKLEAEAIKNTNALADAQEQLNKIKSEYTEVEKIAGGYKYTDKVYTNEQIKAMSNLEKSIKNYQKAISDSEGPIQECYKNMEALSQATGVDLPESFKTAKEKSDGLFTAIKKGSEEIINESVGKGEDFGQGYANGIARKHTEAYNAGYKIGLEALRGTQEAQNSNSPSKEAAKLGGDFGDGYSVGIDGTKTKVKKSSGALAKEALSVISDVNKDVRTNVQKVTDEMNAVVLESEKKYNAEKERISKDTSKTEERIFYESEKKRLSYIKNRTAAQRMADDEYLEGLRESAEKSEVLRKEQNDAYIASLKETSEIERKLYDARIADIENEKDKIVDIYKSMVEEAFDSIEKIEKQQESMAEKLKSYGSLYTKATVNMGNEKFEIFELSDLAQQKNELTEYADALEAVKSRGSVPQEFFETMRGMSVEEGTKFAKTLLQASDTEFQTYIDNWKEKQAEATRISKVLYADEAAEVAKTIEKTFSTYDADLEEQGKENAESWGEGFLEKLSGIIPKIKAQISSAFENIATGTGGIVFSGAGGTSYTNNYQSTYVLQPSSGESTQAQLSTIRKEELLNKLRGR